MRTVLTDAVVVSGAVGVSLLFRADDPSWDLGYDRIRVESWVMSVLVALGWFAALWVSGVWDRRSLGRGTGEFRRLSRATLFFFGAVGVLAYLLRANLARGYLAVALPLGLLLLLASHAWWRRWLHGRHRAGRLLTDVLVVGRPAGASYLARRLQLNPSSGYRVVGFCLDEDDEAPDEGRFPVVGTLHDVAETVHRLGVQAVAVASSDLFGPDRVRALAWQLEGTGTRVILAPSLVDVAGPRIHIRPVAGLPLMQVEKPRFKGARLITKKLFDLCAATAGLLLLAPVLIGVAIAVKLSDPGPVLFRQMRVGMGGDTFHMWKFRSMHTDAEQRQAELAVQSDGNAVLFKIKDDPRVTKVGRLLRRLSIDELPQLFNVLTGDMSLVGPRPPLACEVALYDKDVHRRFLVKPGLTGLWQVSGRSDLTWDESVRLDLYYVENWSVTGDLSIIAKTVRAVLGKSGAY